MPYIEYDDNRIWAADDIVKNRLPAECQTAKMEVSGEVHYWICNRWDGFDTTRTPDIRLVKRENERVYLIFRGSGEEILVG